MLEHRIRLVKNHGWNIWCHAHLFYSHHVYKGTLVTPSANRNPVCLCNCKLKSLRAKILSPQRSYAPHLQEDFSPGLANDAQWWVFRTDKEKSLDFVWFSYGIHYHKVFLSRFKHGASLWACEVSLWCVCVDQEAERDASGKGLKKVFWNY